MMFPTHDAIDPATLAKEVEDRGFDSLWFPEHSHIPVSRRTPWGGIAGAPPLPDEYARTHDQFVALAAAAAVTTTLRLGTGITLVAQRDPLWLAKEVASLDVISGGRVLFGIGYGWNHEEMESHGVDIAHRRAVVREKVLACKALWSQEVAEFHGKYVNFEPSWAWPKPLQAPHPPIVIGASPTDLHFRHIVEYGDVWMPIQGRWAIDEAWLKLQQAAADAGRDPASLSLGIYAAKPDKDSLAAMRDVGASMAAMVLPPLDRDAALATMDSYAPLVEEFNTPAAR
jgi:probable F420-dependent oxidoreductase